MSDEYIVISVKHTKRTDPYITLWNPEDEGYCFRIEAAGRYDQGRILANISYYNSGCDSVAVRHDDLIALAVQVKKGYLGNDGLVIPNNAKSWKTIKLATILPPIHQVYPEYRGAPIKKTK